METTSKLKVKVEPGFISTRMDELDSPVEIHIAKPVDEQMLQLFLALSADGNNNFVDERSAYFENVSQNLRHAQGCLVTKDRERLDKLAQDLSHSALKMGAAQLLSSAIEIQGLARIGDFQTAAELLGRMEVELVEVKAHYA